MSTLLTQNTNTYQPPAKVLTGTSMENSCPAKSARECWTSLTGGKAGNTRTSGLLLLNCHVTHCQFAQLNDDYSHMILWLHSLKITQGPGTSRGKGNQVISEDSTRMKNKMGENEIDKLEKNIQQLFSQWNALKLLLDSSAPLAHLHDRFWGCLINCNYVVA